MADAAEVRGWSRWSVAVAERAVVDTVESVHRAVLHRTLRWLGPLGAPVRRVATPALDLAYGAVRFGLVGAGATVAAFAAHPPSAPREAANEDDGAAAALLPPPVSRARAIAQGIVADDLLAAAPELDVPMTLQVATPEGAPTGVLVVFVHGLVDRDVLWRGVGDGRPTLPDVVTEHTGTAVLARYGTGRAIGTNGAALATSLEDLVRTWPVPVERVVLVGHSMGGLVSRAALHYGHADGHGWRRLVSDVVHLATPHGGSWLEKVANVTAWTLRTSDPVAAPFGTLIDGRSRGIKDLRFGGFVADPAPGPDPDGLLTGRAAPPPWEAGPRHHLVAGRVRQAPGHPLNHLFGDGLVRRRSATGGGLRPDPDGQPPGDTVTVTEVAAGHHAIVHHPEVVALLQQVLTTR